MSTGTFASIFVGQRVLKYCAVGYLLEMYGAFGVARRTRIGGRYSYQISCENMGVSLSKLVLANCRKNFVAVWPKASLTEKSPALLVKDGKE